MTTSSSTGSSRFLPILPMFLTLLLEEKLICFFFPAVFWIIFYVNQDFVVQSGDPTGTGRGGESIYGLVAVLSFRIGDSEFIFLLLL